MSRHRFVRNLVHEYEEEEENYEEDEEEEFEEDEYYNRKQDAEDYDDAQPAPIPAPKPKPSVESQQQQQKVQPSVLAKELSNKPATTSSTTPQGTLPDFVASAVQPRFDFSEPSPDDLVRAQHKQAFQPGKNKSVPQSQNKPAVLTISASTASTKFVKKAAPEKKPKHPPSPTLHPTSAPPEDAHKSKSIVAQVQHSAARNEQILKLLSNVQEISLVTVGHVDAGKSTTMGHLLFLLGRVSQQTLQRYERESARIGKASFAYAWVLDEHEDERARGITMDVGVTNFETKKLSVTLLDAPGHRDFIPNMISGASQADAAVLVIHSGLGEFEAGFDSNGQTKEHALLIRSLGVTQLIVAINQMDKVGWSQERYTYISEQVATFLKKSGFRDSSFKFVPCSGLTGENLVKCSEPALTSWYNGPTLLEAIDSFSVAARSRADPFRLSIGDVYKAQSMGLCIGGKIEAGILGVQDKLLVVPSTEIASVKAIWRSQVPTEVGAAGDNVDISLLDVDISQLGVGSVLCDPAHPVPATTKFLAQILTFTLDIPITNGMQALLYAHNISSSVTLTKLVSIIDRATGTVTNKRPRALGDQATAEVEITVDGAGIAIEEYSLCKALGRFTLRVGGKTIAGGVIKKVLEKFVGK